MKRILQTLILILASGMAMAQAPNAFNYSAVARNANNQPIANTNIGLQISILKTSLVGNTVYSENHFVNTDEFGVFNLSVGNGAIQSGAFVNIDWGSDNYYLKVGFDANGGTNFLTMGTTQLLSVPYALHAKTAGSVMGGGFTHYIGEQFGGGVIFHLWKDAQGEEHGLIVDFDDLSVGQIWSSVNSTLIGPSAQSFWDGLSNSNAIIVAHTGYTNSAAYLCLNSINGGYNDWYLPSIQELNMLWNNYPAVARSLSQIPGGTQLSSTSYWSSTESSGSGAWTFNFINGGAIGSSKNSPNYVRAVRAF
jgi:hypothetical protein